MSKYRNTKFCIEASLYNTLLLLDPEIFPTPLRIGYAQQTSPFDGYPKKNCKYYSWTSSDYIFCTAEDMQKLVKELYKKFLFKYVDQFGMVYTYRDKTISLGSLHHYEDYHEID